MLWDRNGRDAAYLVRGLDRNDIPATDFHGFVAHHKNWVERYPRRNLRINFHKTVHRWLDY